MTAVKTDLRRRLRRARAAVSDRERRERDIRTRLQPLLEGPEATRVVAAYAAAGSEVSLDAWLVESFGRGRRVALPRCVAEAGLDWVEIRRIDELAPGRHGLREPGPVVAADPARRVRPDAVGTVLVPGVGFTADGRRLGQGGGYYDRFLSRWRATVSEGLAIGIAFDVQIVGDIPCKPHDARVDLIVTETRVIDCRRGPTCP